MPIREVDIQYEFPLSQDHKLGLINHHQWQGRMWLSTAIVDGKTRMRFGRFEHYVEATPEIIVDRFPHKPRSDIGKPRKKVLTPVVGYPGKSGSGRPEWDR